MPISAIGRAFIAKREWAPFTKTCGWDAAKQLYFPYRDYKGFPTFGIGHLIVAGDDFSAGRTSEQVDELFARDILKYGNAVDKLSSDLVSAGLPALEQNQIDALGDFCFNLGTGALDPRRNSAIKALFDGHPEKVPALLLPWDMTAGVHDKGLRNRRAAEGYVWDHPYPAAEETREEYLASVHAILDRAPQFDLTDDIFGDEEPPTENDRDPIT